MGKNKLYTLKEAAEMIGISEQTLRRWDESGKIRCDRTKGGHRRISTIEMQKIAKIHEVKNEFFCNKCHKRIDKKQVEESWYNNILFPQKICPTCDAENESKNYDEKLKSESNLISRNCIEWNKRALYEKCHNCHSNYAKAWLYCTNCNAPRHFEIITLSVIQDENGKFMSNREEMDKKNCDNCKYCNKNRHCIEYDFDITNYKSNLVTSFADVYMENIPRKFFENTESVTVCLVFEPRDV